MSGRKIPASQVVSHGPPLEPTPSLGSGDPLASLRAPADEVCVPRHAEGVPSMRYRSLAVAGSLTLLVALSARAEFPFLADANRCDSSGNPPGCIPLPNEMSGCNGEMWKFASTSVCTTDPTVLNSPNELFGVSGMSVETAWRLETGRPDVVIAVLDSGIKWNDLGALNDLRKKFYLNRGELPVP